MSKYYGDDEVESELEVGFMCLAVGVSTCQVCLPLPYFHVLPKAEHCERLAQEPDWRVAGL